MQVEDLEHALQTETVRVILLVCWLPSFLSSDLGENLLSCMQTWLTDRCKQDGERANEVQALAPSLDTSFPPLHISLFQQLERALTCVSSVNAAGGDNNTFLRAINKVTGFINYRLWQYSLLWDFFFFDGHLVISNGLTSQILHFYLWPRLK